MHEVPPGAEIGSVDAIPLSYGSAEIGCDESPASGFSRGVAFCSQNLDRITYNSFMKTTSLSTNCVHSSLGRSALFSFVLACFAFSPTVRAQQNCGPRVFPFPVFNVALGCDALANAERFAGVENTAIGSGAMKLNTTGIENTAVGAAALNQNTDGNDNAAIGSRALSANTTGDFNVANGAFALEVNRIGSKNTAAGLGALRNNITGNSNVAVGFEALANSQSSVSNTALGANAGKNIRSGSNNLDIDNLGEARDQNTIRIGDESHVRTFIGGISGVGVTNAAAVFVNEDGQLGTAPSSQRFKDEIKPMDKASEALLALNPITFRYNKEIDPKRIAQFGLVAEDVARVNPDLVVRDKQGKPYTVRYEAVNAMLLNEFLKEHRKNEEQQATIAQLKSGLEALFATVKEQAAEIQKVTAHLEASKPAAQVVLNRQ